MDPLFILFLTFPTFWNELAFLLIGGSPLWNVDFFALRGLCLFCLLLLSPVPSRCWIIIHRWMKGGWLLWKWQNQEGEVGSEEGSTQDSACALAPREAAAAATLSPALAGHHPARCPSWARKADSVGSEGCRSLCSWNSKGCSTSGALGISGFYPGFPGSWSVGGAPFTVGSGKSFPTSSFIHRGPSHVLFVFTMILSSTAVLNRKGFGKSVLFGSEFFCLPWTWS